MATIQTITFTKNDPAFNAEEMLTVLHSVTSFADYTIYMQSIEDKFSNVWTENLNEVIIQRTWADDAAYAEYQTTQETWDIEFKAALDGAGITVTETEETV